MAVWIAVPTVKIADHMRMEPRRPKRSEVNACPSAPTKVLGTMDNQTLDMLDLGAMKRTRLTLLRGGT